MVNCERLVKLRSDVEKLGITLKYIANHCYTTESNLRRVMLGLKRDVALLNKAKNLIALISSNPRFLVDKKSPYRLK